MLLPALVAASLAGARLAAGDSGSGVELLASDRSAAVELFAYDSAWDEPVYLLDEEGSSRPGEFIAAVDGAVSTFDTTVWGSAAQQSTVTELTWWGEGAAIAGFEETGWHESFAGLGRSRFAMSIALQEPRTLYLEAALEVLVDGASTASACVRIVAIDLAADEGPPASPLYESCLDSSGQVPLLAWILLPAGAHTLEIVAESAVTQMETAAAGEGYAGFAFSAAIVPPPTVATPDLDGNGVVDGADLGLLLCAWGQEGEQAGAADLDGSGRVDGADLGVLLAHFGSREVVGGN